MNFHPNNKITRVTESSLVLRVVYRRKSCHKNKKQMMNEWPRRRSSGETSQILPRWNLCKFHSFFIFHFLYCIYLIFEQFPVSIKTFAWSNVVAETLLIFIKYFVVVSIYFKPQFSLSPPLFLYHFFSYFAGIFWSSRVQLRWSRKKIWKASSSTLTPYTLPVWVTPSTSFSPFL